MFKIITINQELEWKDIVKKSFKYDFYHTWQYHQIATEGEPMMFVYQVNKDFIAFPLLKRNIPNSTWFDLTSVYGYSGPLSNLPFTKLNKLMIANFKSEFINYLKLNNYVSVFSGLHPFFNQLVIMNSFSGIHDNGKTVVIDLKESLEEQRARYQKRLNNKINRLKRLGFYIKEDNSSAAIKQFINIYTENMNRVEANSFYMFSEEYFKSLIANDELNSKLLFIYFENKPVCGAIVTFTSQIVQCYLMGTCTAYLKYSPSKLMNDEIAILGRKMGMHYFNLGGGLGFKEDSLYYFKTSFTDLHLDYKTWRFIVDQNKYDLLNANLGISNVEIDYFPLYRSKNNTSDIRQFQDLQTSA